jgi:hypothetical protein
MTDANQHVTLTIGLEFEFTREGREHEALPLQLGFFVEWCLRLEDPGDPVSLEVHPERLKRCKSFIYPVNVSA